VQQRNDESPASDGDHDTPFKLPLLGELSTFIGRGEELIELRQLLAAGRREVTLKGPGGVGKTRIMRRLARELRDEGTYRDGVVIVKLADLRPEADQVESAIAQALGIPNNSHKFSQARLIAHMRDKRMLLLLDNCEHLLGHDGTLPVLVPRLLEAAEDLQIVATSRVELGIDGEAWFDVPPLSEDEALELLVDRAAAINVTITPNQHPVARQVVNRVDRLPLAVELVARRTDTLTLAKLAARPDLPKILEGGTSAQDHHRNLMATIAWSYDLLSEAEQCLWRRLAVFESGFDLDGAVALCRDLGNEDQVADVLGSLIKRSVVEKEPYRGTRRFRILETIRHYGYEQLTDDEADSLRVQHAEYFEKLACRAAAKWFGPDEGDWLDLLGVELPNFRAAEETLIAAEESALRGLELYNNISRTRLFYFLGRLSDSDRMLQDALRWHPEEPSLNQVSALSLAATVALCQGDRDRGLRLLAAAEDTAHRLACYDETGPLLYARAARLWLTKSSTGAARKSLPLFQQAADWFRANGALGDEWMARLLRVMAAALLGVETVAVPESKLLLEDAESAGAAWCISWAKWARALTVMLFGKDLSEATRLAQEALQAQYEMGDKWGLNWSKWLISLLAAMARQFATAARLLAGVATGQRQAEVIMAGLLPFAELENTIMRTGRRDFEDWETEYEMGRSLTAKQVYYLARGPIIAATNVPAPAPRPGVLSPKQFEVAGLIADGLKNMEIAALLQISTRTVEKHVANITDKLNAKGGRRGSVAEITRWYLENRIS
jgi:non-specific serine/threonine protein kinase